MHECKLLQKGIIAMPIEAAAFNSVHCAHDEEVHKMRLRQQERLAYGSTALVIVNPRENHGHDIVPVIVGRKGPQRFLKREHSADGMFSVGDTMIYVHDLQFVRNMQSSEGTIQAVFELPKRIDERVMRRLPLACFVGEGKTIGSYLERLTPKDDNGRELWGLNSITVRRARGEGFFQCTRPSETFCQTGYACDLSTAEIVRAPRMGAQYKLGHQLSKTVDIPCDIAASLMKENLVSRTIKTIRLTGTIAIKYFFKPVRLYEYGVEWEANRVGHRVRELLEIPDTFDEGSL